MTAGVLFVVLLALPILEFTKEFANSFKKFTDDSKNLVLLVGGT